MQETHANIEHNKKYKTQNLKLNQLVQSASQWHIHKQLITSIIWAFSNLKQTIKQSIYHISYAWIFYSWATCFFY